MIEVNLLKPKAISYSFKDFYTGRVESWYTVISVYVGWHYHQLRLTTRRQYTTVPLDRVRKVSEWQYAPHPPEIPA